MEQLYQLSADFLCGTQSSFERLLPGERAFEAPCTILLGQRGVGKTTRVLQYLQKQFDSKVTNRVLYVPCDHYYFQGHSIYQVAQMFHLNGGAIIAFDEIHRYPDWSRELKSAIDSFPDLKFIGTGSSLLEIEKGTHDLSRRSIVLELQGLSFREYLEFMGYLQVSPIDISKLFQNHVSLAKTVVSELAQHKQKVIPLFQAYLACGYYPYFNKHAIIRDYYLTLQQNIDRMLASDLLAISPNLSGRAVRKMQALISHLATHTPFSPDMKRLAANLNIGDERTLYDYLDYLEGLRLIKMLRHKGSLRTEMTKPEKIYLNNTTLMHALSQHRITDTGNLRETFFLSATSAVTDVRSPKKGDFLLDENLVIEVGGRNKTFDQIKDSQNAYLVLDNVEVGYQRRIPLWLFGFLY